MCILTCIYTVLLALAIRFNLHLKYIPRQTACACDNIKFHARGSPTIYAIPIMPFPHSASKNAAVYNVRSLVYIRQRKTASWPGRNAGEKGDECTSPATFHLSGALSSTAPGVITHSSAVRAANNARPQDQTTTSRTSPTSTHKFGTDKSSIIQCVCQLFIEGYMVGYGF